MAKRIYHVNDWAPAQEAMFDDDASPVAAGSPKKLDSLDPPLRPDQHPRSLSLSLPWRRPRPALMMGHAEVNDLLQPLDSLALDDSHQLSACPREASGAPAPASSRSLRGMLRRASLSLKGMVHRRPSHSNGESALDEQDEHTRPNTSYPSWGRLRRAKSSRHVRSMNGLDLSRDSSHPPHHQQQPLALSPNMPLPSTGRDPPIIPTHTGAAAKASAAWQNEFLALHGAQKRWLYAPASSEDGNDRESGIGISVTVPCIEAGDTCEGVVPAQDTSISRIDFIARLPVELCIQILAFLDAGALAKACRVSRRWDFVVRNTHVWKESCLRETTATYATGGSVAPGTGLGIPSVKPDVDWRRVYRARHELSQRWKSGKARTAYLNGHLDSIYCLQFDEHKIVSGSRDKTIRIWDMHTLECRLVIGPPEVVYGTKLVPDDDGNATHYATGAESGRTAQSTPAVVSFSQHHKASILCLQYDDDILVTGSSDASCIVYDVHAGYQPVRRLLHHSAAVLDLAFDDKHIVTCSKDITICVWDRETGSLLRQLRGHTGPVNAVQMRGNTIVSCSGDFRVKLWNIDTGKNIREFVGHTKGLACSQFSEDGRYVASAGNDKVIRIWDANTGECVREMEAHENLVRSLHIDSISGRLVSGSYDTDIKVWDMETGYQLLDFPRWHASWVLSAKSDYRRIVSTGQDPKILVMDFGAGVDVELLESERRDEGSFDHGMIL